MKSKKISVCLVGLAAMVTVGCDTAREAIYQSKQAPDGFAVYTRAPLSLPPEYDLRPPQPGAAARNTLDPQGTAAKAVFGSEPKPASVETPEGASQGTASLLERTGALQANPEIRQQVERETSVLLEEDDTLADKIMFWRSKDAFGTVVNPTKEQARVQENQALGKTLTEGEVPTIERRKRSTFEKFLQ